MNSDHNQKKDSRTDAGAALVEYTELFVFAAAAVIVLLTFFFRFCRVEGPSMNQTLYDGQGLIVSDLFYTPKQGDIVVFHETSSTVDRLNEPIIKRVIAVGGQYVKIDYQNNHVYVSDDREFTAEEILDESGYEYLSGGVWKEASFLDESGIFEVPTGYLFVMGDNRNNSADSRYTAIGMVDQRRILGHVLLRITPFSLFGKVN